MDTVANNGIVDRLSNHSVDETVEKLKAILPSKGVTLFATVDHSGEAAKVGMKMRPTKLVIFGSPKAGTPLMLATPSADASYQAGDFWQPEGRDAVDAGDSERGHRFAS